jgi:hypothetical protein
MSYPLDYGTTYTNTINATDLLSNPAHAAIHNAIATELYYLKRRPMAMYYVGGYMTTGKTAGAALIDAVADMNANGGGLVVLLPNTTHIIPSKLQIGSYGGILGQGYGSVVQLANNTNLSSISNNNFSSGNTGIYLSNFRLEGNKTNQSSSVYGFDLRKITKSIFENLWVNNCKSHGMSTW